jgi:hypothetical protein
MWVPHRSGGWFEKQDAHNVLRDRVYSIAWLMYAVDELKVDYCECNRCDVGTTPKTASKATVRLPWLQIWNFRFKAVLGLIFWSNKRSMYFWCHHFSPTASKENHVLCRPSKLAQRCPRGHCRRLRQTHVFIGPITLQNSESLYSQSCSASLDGACLE